MKKIIGLISCIVFPAVSVPEGFTLQFMGGACFVNTILSPKIHFPPMLDYTGSVQAQPTCFVGELSLGYQMPLFDTTFATFSIDALKLGKMGALKNFTLTAPGGSPFADPLSISQMLFSYGISIGVGKYFTPQWGAVLKLKGKVGAFSTTFKNLKDSNLSGSQRSPAIGGGPAVEILYVISPHMTARAEYGYHLYQSSPSDPIFSSRFYTSSCPFKTQFHTFMIGVSWIS